MMTSHKAGARGSGYRPSSSSGRASLRSFSSLSGGTGGVSLANSSRQMRQQQHVLHRRPASAPSPSEEAQRVRSSFAADSREEDASSRFFIPVSRQSSWARRNPNSSNTSGSGTSSSLSKQRVSGGGKQSTASRTRTLPTSRMGMAPLHSPPPKSFNSERLRKAGRDSGGTRLPPSRSTGSGGRRESSEGSAHLALSRQPSLMRRPSSSQTDRSTGGERAASMRPRSSGQVRQQYLAHLGIDQKAGGSAVGSSVSLPTSPTAAAASTPSHMSSLEPHASPPVLQSLNGGSGVWWQRAFGAKPALATQSEAERDGKKTGADSGPRRVSFNDMVEVRYVPLHSDYSQRIRQKYWNSAQELWDMAARNSIEFAAEGYDWTRAVEEESFTRWGGQLIHPAHMQNSQFTALQRSSLASSR
eukprot:CAMPEP_0118989090 /NCGR_PEP_ID=MMETSP1173-20130426/47347_1 /TAXON_ID=1034831 /ORGANISM="Rhizochromulina marina cf, Strain CCMP1243" /LENGTH=414 /DNA_ID=CAMNT_0006940055 /DNA_START=29 /DNA_END=1273 /DNA_ORIENTATION=-